MTVKVRWQLQALPLNLPESEVHIWRVDLSHVTDDIENHLEVLSKEERLQAERFHFEHHRQRYILSHSGLRQLLGAYLGVEPGAVTFEITERGKPHLGIEFCTSGVEFNLTHSGDLALIGFLRGAGIGVDIEQVRPMPDLQRLAARYFSKHEQEQLAQLPDDKKGDGFFKCWTCKEAILKNIGDGLYIPLHQFEVDVDPDHPACLLRVASDPHETSHWHLENFLAGEGYPAALAVRGEVGRVRYLNFSPG